MSNIFDSILEIHILHQHTIEPSLAVTLIRPYRNFGHLGTMHRFKTEGSPTPNGGKICSNFAAPSPGVIESRNHGHSLFQQWQHGSGFCTNFLTSGCI